jgi:hypothetical protein
VDERADQFGELVLVASCVGCRCAGACGEVAHDAEDSALFDIGAGPRSERHDAPLELFAGAVADPFAQRNGSGHVERLELVEQARAFRDRGAPDVQQRPQRRGNPAAP